MSIQTETVQHQMPYAFSDRAGYETIQPIVCPGDQITITNFWADPVVGTVLQVSEAGLLWVDVPVATNGGGPAVVVSRSYVTRIERGECIWERNPAIACDNNG
jgi:hypothetical protein